MKSYYLGRYKEEEEEAAATDGPSGSKRRRMEREEDPSSSVVKCKGMRAASRRVMTSSDFRMTERDKPRFTSFALRPTTSREIIIERQSRILQSCVNYKRKLLKVRSRGVGRSLSLSHPSSSF